MRKYDDEFKQQAVKKVFDGQSVASVSRELGVAESLIHKWKGDARSKGANGVASTESKENAALKKRVKELEQEVEILKKAALIFGRGS
ncbi:MAG: transposase [Blastocatellia bacterium]|nr:transposase [Blastocatellia bacterium]